jgi:aspartyl protease family protein
MIGRLASTALLCAMGMALFGPQLGMRAVEMAGAPQQGNAGDGGMPQQELAGSRLSPGAGITLRRSGDSHFRASVDVNGTPLTMLVDSGATLVVLRESDAMRAGITLGPNAYSGRVQTAGGLVRAAECAGSGDGGCAFARIAAGAGFSGQCCRDARGRRGNAATLASWP